jgi:hypothetical protein
MAFLFAHYADGSIRHFEKAALAFFFPNSLGTPPNSVGKLYVQGRLTFAEYEIIVFGDLRWFKGTVECHDYAHNSPRAKGVPSTSFPTSSLAKIEPLPLPPPKPVSSSNPFSEICPTMATAETVHYIFKPNGPFFEITELDAIKWLYKHVQHVPHRAHAAIEKVRRAAMAPESSTIRGNPTLTPCAQVEPQNTPGTDRPSMKLSDPDTAQSGSASSRRTTGGRPPDTDSKKDKRIASAWSTGRHKTYEALGAELGEHPTEVKKALDRHRHRAGKTNS